MTWYQYSSLSFLQIKKYVSRDSYISSLSFLHGNLSRFAPVKAWDVSSEGRVMFWGHGILKCVWFFFFFHECYRVKWCNYKKFFFSNEIFQSTQVHILCIATPLKEMSCNSGEEPGHLSEWASLSSFLKDSIQCVPLSGTHNWPVQPLWSGHFFSPSIIPFLCSPVYKVSP